ncbi:MAG TPA: hypothetical protein VFD07_10455 [Candidatus Krumholzibacteria bacterium]|nr:hypothetical protein [Candidatus Krumholzibacteria bacterium]
MNEARLAHPPRQMLPWTRSCMVCGQDNPVGLRARSYKSGDLVQLPFTTRVEYAGWSNVMHGGFIAMVLDEVMTWAAILGSSLPCFAADFSVRLQEALPASISCTAMARMRENRRKVFDTEAWLEDDAGRVYARASGRYLPVPAERMAHFRSDFVTSPDCLDLERIFTR